MVIPSAVARSLVTVAVTVPARSGASVSLLTAAIVAVSVAFAVSPAAITNHRVRTHRVEARYRRSPSPSSPRSTECASFAVTVDPPPFSEIDDGDTVSVTPGASSSSVSVSVAPLTVPVPWLLLSVAVTVAVRSGSSLRVVHRRDRRRVRRVRRRTRRDHDRRVRAHRVGPRHRRHRHRRRLARRVRQRRAHRRGPAVLRDRRRVQRKLGVRRVVVVLQRQRGPRSPSPCPWLLASVAVTVAVRSGSSFVLSTAAIAAVSVAFAVEPAAITITASEPTV